MYETKKINGRQVRLEKSTKPVRVAKVISLHKKNGRSFKKRKVVPFLIENGYKAAKNMSNKRLNKIMCAYNGNRRISLNRFYKKHILCETLPPVPTKKVQFVKTNDFLQSFKWRRIRYEALKLNDGRCELCGRGKKDGIVLNVDHIKPRKTHPQLALDLKNLQILCGPCNHGKGNMDDTDWR